MATLVLTTSANSSPPYADHASTYSGSTYYCSTYYCSTIALLTLQRDLFAAKLAKVKSMDKWTQHSKHFSAEKKSQLARLGSDYDKCIQATKEVFIDLNKDAANRQVYCHATCATDTSNISFVMSAVFDVILKVSMVKG